MKGLLTTTQRSSQRGATAIEFSIVFALLFGIFWAIISYALPFFLYQTMNHAVSEAARYTIRVSPEQSDGDIVALTESELFNQQLNILPNKFKSLLITANETPVSVVTTTLDGTAYRTVNVELHYPGCSTNSQQSCFVPAINLFGVSIPNLSGFTVSAQYRLARE